MVLWWLVFLIMLPFAYKKGEQDTVKIKGADPGAPQKPALKRTFFLTCLITLFIFLLVYAIIEFHLFQWTDIPFFSNTEGY